MSRPLRALLFCLLPLLAVVPPSLAQTPANVAVVTGRVLDVSGGALAGARVHLKDRTNGLTAQTDHAGVFQLTQVPPGAYTLRIERPGFEAQEARVTIGATAVALPDTLLNAEAVRTSVTVSENAGFEVDVAATATKTPTPLRDVPQAIEVINQTLIRSQAALSMQDVLRNVSGVSLHLGEGRRDQVLIRGFSALYDGFIDGVRDDAPYYRDLSNVERVEVLKGPASVLFGRGSSGGIVNRITKQPNQERPILDLSVVAGSYGTKRLTADLGQAFLDGRLAYRVNGAYEESGSHRGFYALDRYNIAPSLLWKPTDRTRVVAQFEHLSDSRLPDRGIPSLNGRPADVPIGTYYGAPSDFMDNRVLAGALTVEHQLADAWTVRNVFRRTRYANNYSTTYPLVTRTVNGTLLATRAQYETDAVQQNLFNQTEAVGSGRFLGLRHTLLVGVEAGRQRLDNVRLTGTAADVALFNPVLTDPNRGLSPTNNNLFRGNVFGVYVQDQITLGRGWKALLGVRRDRFTQFLDDRSARNVDLRRTDGVWSPRAGLVYQPAGWVSLYGSVSKSFQPSGEGLSLAANNADLQPETTRNLEVGAKLDVVRGRLSANVALFRLDRNNIKTTDPLDPNRLVLVGAQRTDGLEISLNGTLRRNWSVYGGYALLDGTILRSNTVTSGVRVEGNRPGFVATHSGNLWTTYRFENGFGFGGGAYATGARFTSNDNLVTLPGYLRLDATVFYSQRHWEMNLNLRNLLDRRHYETAHTNTQIFPGAPVNGLVTLRYRW